VPLDVARRVRSVSGVGAEPSARTLVDEFQRCRPNFPCFSQLRACEPPDRCSGDDSLILANRMNNIMYLLVHAMYRMLIRGIRIIRNYASLRKSDDGALFTEIFLSFPAYGGFMGIRLALRASRVSNNLRSTRKIPESVSFIRSETLL